MIAIDNTDVNGLRAALRGMRNPFDSWFMSDSRMEDGTFRAGPKDLALASRLAEAGDDHGKLTRFIVVTTDIKAPLYWWKEMDTYKVGTVANSCSTMHTLLKRDFRIDDFSTDGSQYSVNAIKPIVDTLNDLRDRWKYYEDQMVPDVAHSNEVWRTIVQMLPCSYMQKRTWQANYMVLHHIFNARKHHRLTEWHDFCDWILTLPQYTRIYTKDTIEENNENDKA